MKRFFQLSMAIIIILSLFSPVGTKFGVRDVQAAITRPANWSSQYANTAYPNGVVSSYTVAAGTERLLVVAIASTRTSVGSQTVSVSYGGQALTLAAGDGSSTATWNHSYLYYLNEAGITAATTTNLSVTITGGTAYYTRVYAAVYAGVDQTTPFTSARNYNSATANSTVGPFNPTLTIAEGDQAIEIVNLARSASGTNLRQISTWAAGWTTAGVAQSYNSVTGPTQQMYIRDRNILTAANDPSQHTADNNNTWDSMTAMSIKPTTPPPTNPPLTASCGLDIVLVLDVSTSVGSTAYTQMQNAFVAFIDAFLPATPTQIAVVQFSNYAGVVTGFTNNLTTLYGDKGVTNWGALTRQTYGTGIQYTNFDDALYDARNLFPNRFDYPDLIIFGTDGNPNRIGGHEGQAVTVADEATAMSAAVAEADLAQAAGIRILSIGIGSGIDTNNLIAISGPVVAPPITVNTDVITADFSTLATALAALASDLCGGTCTVYKVLDDDKENGTLDKDVESGGGVAGWDMTVTAMSTGTTLAAGQAATETTTTSGAVNFEFDIQSGAIPAAISIQETLKSSEWEFLGAECFVNGTTPISVDVDLDTRTVSGIDFTNYNDIVSCYFYNYPKPTYVELIFFTARTEGQAIVLTWQTATEIDNLGFNLYRATSPEGERIQINPELLPSAVLPGSEVGALYEFVDSDVVLGEQYFYWLEDVDLAGRVKSINGPVEARVQPFKMFLPVLVN